MRRMLACLAAGALAVTLATPALASPMNFTATLTVTVGFPPWFSLHGREKTITATATASGVGSGGHRRRGGHPSGRLVLDRRGPAWSARRFSTSCPPS